MTFDALTLLAEISVGIAGFAGVAVLLGRGPGRWNPADAIRIRLLLAAAFSVLFACVVSVGSRAAGLAEDASIRIGSGALLLGQLYWLEWLARQTYRLPPADAALISPRLRILFRTVGYASCLAQVVVLAGVFPALAYGLFFFGLLVSLAYSALGFVRLMFIRPISETAGS